MKSMITAFAFVSLVTFSGIALAEDAPKAMAVAHAEQSAALKSVACPDPCNFEVRSRDEKELISLVKTHAKKVHKLSLSDQKIKEMAKTVN